MSINFGMCGAVNMLYDRVYSVTSREPLPYTKMEVKTSDASGNPLETAYYYNDELVFTTLQEWNAQNKETYFEVFTP